MTFFSKIFKQIFTKTLTIYITFRNNRFCLSFTVNRRNLTYSQALQYASLNKYLKGAIPTNQDYIFSIPFNNAKLLYDDFQNNFFHSQGIELIFSERTRKMVFKKCEGEVQFAYHLNLEEGYLKRNLVAGMLQLTAHYFLQDHTIWVLENNEISHLIRQEKLEGEDIIKLIANRQSNNIAIDLSLATICAATLSCQKISDTHFILSILYHVSKDEWLFIKHLPSYVLVNKQLYRIPEKALLEEAFADNNTYQLIGAQIPYFVDKYGQSILNCGDDGIKSKLKPNELLMRSKDIKLALRCESNMKNGVGNAVAIPVIQYEEECLPASELLEAKRDAYVYAFDKWIGEEVLRCIGIGEIGRLLDGTPLASVVLNPAEIINRGSGRLQRLANAFIFDETDWQSKGTRQEIFISHMRFLRKYGMNGGVVATIDGILLTLFIQYMKALKSQIDQGKVLVLMKKNYLEQYITLEGNHDFIVLKGQKSDEQVSETTKGIIITTYNNVEKVPMLSSIKWDIIIMIEPDEVFKTNVSMLYKTISSVKSRLKLGIFKQDLITYSSAKLEAIHQIFKLEASISTKLIRNIELQSSSSLPSAYHFSNEMASEEKGAHIVIDGDEKEDIPITFNVTYTNKSNDFRVTETSQYISSGEQFKRKAQNNASVGGLKSPFVPFMSYWPTYDTMTKSQSKWYFYWRSEARQGRYRDTDLSYIFIYIYELIHGIGYGSADEGYRLLFALWKAYREVYPKLDHYLIDWILDYTILNRLEHRSNEFIKENAAISSSYFYNLYLYKAYIESTQMIEQSSIIDIMSYRITKSKFYNAGYEEILPQELTRVVNVINEYMKQTYSKNIFQFFCPREQKNVSRRAYARAVYAGNETYEMTYTDFLNHRPLIEFLDVVARYTENRLREKYQFTGRLRGIEIEEVFRQIIDKALDVVQIKNSKETSKENRVNKPVIITIDGDKVQGLREDSEEIRRILETEQCTQEEIPTIVGELMADGSATKELLTDLEEIIAVMQSSSEEFMAILHLFYSKGWECTAVQLREALSSSMIECLIDEINEETIRVLSIPLIVIENDIYMIEDDLRDEIAYIFKFPELLNRQVKQEVEIKEGGEIVSAFNLLKDYQIEVLQAISSGELVEDKLGHIAIMLGIMPELLIDEINEVFSECIGDLIVDTSSTLPSIMEEYEEELKRYLIRVVRT